MTGFSLPQEAVIGGKTYTLHTDFRDILEIFSYLERADLPEFIRWQVALALFYQESVPREHFSEAVQYFTRFINCAAPESAGSGRKLLDWERDAQMIVSEVNKVAGQEIRALPFVHWWTFMAWFHAIGEGQLSTVVSIREKLARGKKLEQWERDYYRQNRETIDLPRPESAQEQAYKQQLMEKLGLGR